LAISLSIIFFSVSICVPFFLLVKTPPFTEIPHHPPPSRLRAGHTAARLCTHKTRTPTYTCSPPAAYHLYYPRSASSSHTRLQQLVAQHACVAATQWLGLKPFPWRLPSSCPVREHDCVRVWLEADEVLVMKLVPMRSPVIVTAWEDSRPRATTSCLCPYLGLQLCAQR